ncbi:hypothetical protein A0H81_11173 [Grifola frondosa]|uniref:54S ribosomal protein L20, mitochondrial n=1 Tax=Grifola frondosa TaxID=5627 RepID=A0A1C7M0P4_GRIFR|nr:hypothetical protein A0H81_11173 [Grifola frondosa]
MKPRLPLRLTFARSYATRLPEKPPYRAPDPLQNNPHAVYQELPEKLTFIHRPPPTAPTPFSYTTSPASPLLRGSPAPAAAALPPTLRTDKPEKPRVSDEDLALIRKLRVEDPFMWTRGALAKRFNCTPWFIGQVTSMKRADRKKALALRAQEHEHFRERWGEKRSMIVEIRRKRKEFW